MHLPLLMTHAAQPASHQHLAISAAPHAVIDAYQASLSVKLMVLLKQSPMPCHLPAGLETVEIDLADVQAQLRAFLTSLDAAPSEPTLHPCPADPEPVDLTGDDAHHVAYPDAGLHGLRQTLYATGDAHPHMQRCCMLCILAQQTLKL